MVSRRFPRKAKKRKPAWQDGRVLCHVATELGSDLLRQLLWDDHISEKSRKCLVSNFVEMFRMEFNQSNNGQSSKPLSVWPSKNLGSWPTNKGCIWQLFELFFGFLSWYHLPCICNSNSLELESVILHGICYFFACSPSILHGICYMCAMFKPIHFV